MVSSWSSTTLVVTGKRRRQVNLVLHLSGSSTCESDNDTVSEISLSDSLVPSSSKDKLNRAPIIVNGKLVADDNKRYHCVFEGCAKSYKKPARLEEHERSHTGQRPFVCSTCQKTYLRESHLQAHMRSHLPSSARPFSCTHASCEKRFWTAQHLKRHEELHAGERPFKCSELDCNHSFSKHSQLRSHISSSHCPPGTKTFRCANEGCTKSFATGQKLKVHSKTHEDRRYTCSHSVCLQKEAQEFFSNWTALQAHTRTAHPATCPYISCNGKVFTQQKGLRAHLKLHEQREMEYALAKTSHEDGGDADDEDEERPTKRRRGGEVGRDWKCSEEGCDKEFKSKKALTTHVKVAHLHQRDFVCAVEGCGASFGYKHLLQRHAARIHTASGNSAIDLHSADGDEVLVKATPTVSNTLPDDGLNAIDILTGKAYEDRAKERLAGKDALACPHPDMTCMVGIKFTSQLRNEKFSPPCSFIFSRAYDFRRHLSSVHGLEVDREEAAALVKALRRGKELSGGSTDKV